MIKSGFPVQSCSPRILVSKHLAPGVFMNAVNDIELPRNHLVGWLAIAGSDRGNRIRKNIDRGLNAFVGDYGLRKIIQASDGFGFGFRQPETPLPLTTWSLFSDEQGICFVEGVFYDTYFSHQPIDGEDPQLATLLLKNFKAAGAAALEELSGSFSGFIFDRNKESLATFVDRLSTRVLYWTREKGNLIVSSNLASFRALKSPELDRPAAFQYLTIGFPIGERTLLKDVKIQLPASLVTFQGEANKAVRYWSVPKRINNISLEESSGLIAGAMEEFVRRMYGRTRKVMALGVSGGHDSRIILSALAHEKVPFEAVLRLGGDFNDKVAPSLCSIIKKEPQIAKSINQLELLEVENTVFAYSDGLYSRSAFSMLGKECDSRGITHLMLGFAGDVISGDLTIPAPQYLTNVKQLAKWALNNQLEWFSFDDACALLKFDNHSNRDLILETLADWGQTFSQNNGHDNLVDVAIWQSLGNRNFKRVRFGMAPAARYAQILFPYLDSKILNTYFSLPVSLLHHQKAHCYAGFYRFREFGNYRACPYPISLRNEARFPLPLHLMRISKRLAEGVLTRIGSSIVYHRNVPERYRKDGYNEMGRCSQFDIHSVEAVLRRRQVKQKHFRKLQGLSRFYNFYIRGKDNCLNGASSELPG
jgi:asparagine synthetase B (glutamine-hydrolysing)